MIPAIALAFGALVALLPLDVPAATLPGTLAGQALASLLQAIRASGDRALIAFFERRAEETDPQQRAAAIARRAGFVERLRSAYPELEIAEVERSTGREIATLCRSAVTQAWCRLELEVDEQPPHAIALGFTYASPPAHARHPVALDRRSVARMLDDYVRGLADSGRFSGVVLIANGGRPWFARAYGAHRLSTSGSRSRR